MKKFTKGLFALGLLVALAACKPTTSELPSDSVTSEVPVEKVWVTFFVNEVGGVFEEVEIDKGSKVARPATDPTKAEYEFVDWYLVPNAGDDATPYDFNTLVQADLDLYAKWFKPYTPDTRLWQAVGNFKNTAYPNEWQPNDPTTQMLDIPDDNANIFKITMEMGQYAAFKIKIMEDGWGVEANFSHYDPTQYNTGEIVQADGTNLQVKTAGNYELFWDSDLEVIAMNRLGDAVGEGVVQDLDPGLIKEWGLVGTLTGWGSSPDATFTHNAEGTEYKLGNYLLVAGTVKTPEEFKLRANSEWTFGIGWGAVELKASATGMLTNSAFLTDDPLTTEVDESTLPDLNGNIKVVTSGIYSFKLTWVAEAPVLEVEALPLGGALGLAGGFNGWSSDAHAMTLVADETDPVVKTYTYTYADLVVEADSEFKVKSMATWEVSWGDGIGNKAITAGTHTITFILTVTLSGAERGVVVTFTVA